MSKEQPVNPERRQFFQHLRSRLQSRHPAATPWQQVPDLPAADGDVLWSGWAGEGEVFVVGDEGRILHFDLHALPDEPDAVSSGWQQMPVPVPLPLHGIWGLSRRSLYAVGWMGVILHFDGEQWHKLQGAEVDEEEGRFIASDNNTPLFAIDGNERGEAWAVGDDGRILYFDGEHWQAENSHSRINLRAVICAGDHRVYAAGADGTLLERSPCGSWSSHKSDIGFGFHAILPLAENELLLAGGRYYIDAGGFRGELVHFYQGRFQLLDYGQALSRIRALKAYKDGVLLCGDQGQLHYLDLSAVPQTLSPWPVQQGQLKALACDARHDLMDVITLNSGEALVVGDFCTLMTAADTFIQALASRDDEQPSVQHWQQMPTPTRCQLWGLWQAEDGRCYVCGEAGTVLVLEDEHWQPLPAPSDLAVHCLWSCEGSGLFAAGQQGKIFRFDGERWQLHYDLHLDITILALWGSSPRSIFAVGDEGLVLHFDGLSWQRMASGTQSALYDLWGLDDKHLLAAGDFGLILRYNGKNWKDFNAGSEHFMYGVWGAALDDIFAVGLSGSLSHFNGQCWQQIPTRVQDDLLAIDGSRQAGIFAVGTRGCVLRLKGQQWQREDAPVDVGLRAVRVTRQGDVLAVGDKGTVICRRAPDSGAAGSAP